MLVLAAAAGAAPNAFTASLTPTLVRPSTSASYTLTLTSAATSDQADKAKIAIPTGFSTPTGVTATTPAACNGNAVTWEADGTLIANNAINLKRPGGGGNASLCPGGVLTVKFTSVSPAAEGSYAWTPQLYGTVDGLAFPTFTGNVSVTVDGTAPETAITANPPPITNQASATFTFTSSEAGSTFQCSLDNPTTFGACPPGGYTGLSQGQHTFRVRATDAAGNTDATPAAYTWTVDTIAPNTTITANPPASTNLTNASFSFTSEPGTTFECSLDALNNDAFAPCSSPHSYAGLPGGTRTFHVRARDQAGNTGSSAVWTWTINLVGPPTQIMTAPPNATNSTSASFTFSASAQTGFECRLDGALFSQCVSPAAYNDLADGTHRFAVRTVGPNSTGPEALHTWTVDTRSPRATVVSGPAGLANSRSASFVFSADEPSSFQCRLDGGPLAPCISPVSYQNLSDGPHTFAAVPTDAVGNPGASAAYGWTVDATAPETTLGSRPSSKTTASTATFRFAANEAASAFECKLDAGRFVRCASPKRYAQLRRSRHTFAVRAIDAAGNRDATPASHQWTIGLAKAASALISPAAGARIASPPLLRWRRVARASYYNVQVFRGGVKVLSVWPTSTRFQLRARWTFLGRQYRLSSGKYSWFVWPRFGRGAAGRYGNALGKSTFTVNASRRR